MQNAANHQVSEVTFFPAPEDVSGTRSAGRPVFCDRQLATQPIYFLIKEPKQLHVFAVFRGRQSFLVSRRLSGRLGYHVCMGPVRYDQDDDDGDEDDDDDDDDGDDVGDAVASCTSRCGDAYDPLRSCLTFR